MGEIKNPLDQECATTDLTIKRDTNHIGRLLNFYAEHVRECNVRESQDLGPLSVTQPFLNLAGDDTTFNSTDWSLDNSLSPANCIFFRKVAALASQFQLVSACNRFIRSNFNEMLGQKEVLCLPRLQVNVNVSKISQDHWSADAFILDKILPTILRELYTSISHMKIHVLVEKVLEMNLLPDLSAQMVETKKFTNNLSSEKSMPDHIQNVLLSLSARKLDMEDYWGVEDDEISKCWSVVASKVVSSNSALCLVSPTLSESLVVLNVQLVSKDNSRVLCPISPTTGIPLKMGGALFLQMHKAKSGFGLVAVDDSMMSVGGFNRGGALSDVDYFNGSGNLWSPNGRLTCKRARLSVVRWKDTVYAIAGSDGKTELNSMEEFVLSSGSEWKCLPSRLLTPRSDFGAAVLDDQIYVVGGTFFTNVLRSVEVFNTKERRWKPVAPLSMPRKGSSVVACKGKIFAFGGQCYSWSCLNTAECYDPSINQWSPVAPMATARRNACAVAIDDHIYVIGGYDGPKVLDGAVNSMEVFDTVTDTWSEGQPMTLGRSGASAVVMGDAVYVVGGYTGFSFLNSMEKYDLTSKQWTSYVN